MRIIYIFSFILFFNIQLKAQISGTVFRDYNGDGIQQSIAPNLEPGIEGVIVNAYDKTNTIVNTTITAPNGSYTLPFIVLNLNYSPITHALQIL
jgi:hypothetical protein